MVYEERLFVSISKEAYKKWQPKDTYPEFVAQLDWKSKVAVLTGDLNSQVNNGGIEQWAANYYHRCSEDLFLILKKLREFCPETEETSETLTHIQNMVIWGREYGEAIEAGQWTEPEGCEELDVLYYDEYEETFLNIVQSYLEHLKEG